MSLKGMFGPGLDKIAPGASSDKILGLASGQSTADGLMKIASPTAPMDMAMGGGGAAPTPISAPPIVQTPPAAPGASLSLGRAGSGPQLGPVQSPTSTGLEMDLTQPINSTPSTDGIVRTMESPQPNEPWFTWDDAKKALGKVNWSSLGGIGGGRGAPAAGPAPLAHGGGSSVRQPQPMTLGRANPMQLAGRPTGLSRYLFG